MPAIIDQRGGDRPGAYGVQTPPRVAGHGLNGLWSSLGLWGTFVNHVLWDSARAIARMADRQRGV